MRRVFSGSRPIVAAAVLVSVLLAAVAGAAPAPRSDEPSLVKRVMVWIQSRLSVPGG